MKRIVISGATGAIGTALIEKCIAEEVSVLVLCNKNSRRKKQIPRHSLVQVIDYDLSSINELAFSKDKKYDTFYHFAWQSTIGEGRNDLYLQNRNESYSKIFHPFQYYFYYASSNKSFLY